MKRKTKVGRGEKEGEREGRSGRRCPHCQSVLTFSDKPASLLVSLFAGLPVSTLHHLPAPTLPPSTWCSGKKCQTSPQPSLVSLAASHCVTYKLNFVHSLSHCALVTFLPSCVSRLHPVYFLRLLILFSCTSPTSASLHLHLHLRWSMCSGHSPLASHQMLLSMASRSSSKLIFSIYKLPHQLLELFYRSNELCKSPSVDISVQVS